MYQSIIAGGTRRGAAALKALWKSSPLLPQSSVGGRGVTAGDSGGTGLDSCARGKEGADVGISVNSDTYRGPRSATGADSAIGRTNPFQLLWGA